MFVYVDMPTCRLFTEQAGERLSQKSDCVLHDVVDVVVRNASFSPESKQRHETTKANRA